MTIGNASAVGAAVAGGGKKKRNRGGGLPDPTGPAFDPNNSYTAGKNEQPPLNTGPGQAAFGNRDLAVQGALGMIAKGGVGTGGAYGVNQDAFVKGFASDLYDQFRQAKLLNDRKLRFDQFLGHYARQNARQVLPGNLPPHPQRGSAERLRQTLVYPTLAGLVRRKWARATPTQRGYFSEQWTGPARTVIG